MLYLEQKYASLIGPRLERFKRKKPTEWNFRCPFCGDSQYNKTKARGYLYETKGSLRFKCHNCQRGPWTFDYFLKYLDPEIHQDYLLEKIGPKKQNKEPELPDTAVYQPKKIAAETTDMPNAKPLSTLSVEHPARHYVEVVRQLPKIYYSDLYYVPAFKQWINENIEEGKFTSVDYDEGRLIIPFRKKNGELIAVQGRSLEPNANLRYITIKVDEDYPKVWGLDRVNLNKRVYVLEGAFDAMFLNNAIASADASLLSAVNQLNNLADRVLIFDNQPRNRELVRLIGHAVDSGEQISILSLAGGKDINDLILSGWTSDEILQMIDANTVQGLQAKLEYHQWKKI